MAPKKIHPVSKAQLCEVLTTMIENDDLLIFDSRTNTLYGMDDIESVCLNGSAIQIMFHSQSKFGKITLHELARTDNTSPSQANLDVIPGRRLLEYFQLLENRLEALEKPLGAPPGCMPDPGLVEGILSPGQGTGLLGKLLRELFQRIERLETRGTSPSSPRKS